MGITIKVSAEIVLIRTVEADIAAFEYNGIGRGNPVAHHFLKAPVLRVREDHGMAAVQDPFLTHPINNAGTAADLSGEPVVEEGKRGIWIQDATVARDGITDGVVDVGCHREVHDFRNDRPPQHRKSQGSDEAW
jgi:hypothetical protein